jgi:NADH-quinone oxidoreductase subunit F
MTTRFGPVLLARVGRKGSLSLAAYEADGGHASWRKVLAERWEPGRITEIVKASGLRGRGGAGFPCGQKWTFVPKGSGLPGGKPVYLLCNADESEPGTFKDRLLIEKDPHQLLEGICLASYALRVEHAYIYIRGEMWEGARILNDAIEELYGAGLIGEGILGNGLTLHVTVHRGAGAYICGEETALMDSVEGKRGQARVKPPFPAVRGIWGAPTIINNVETLCAVKQIVDRGADWFRSIGRNERNTGPKLFSFSGHVARPGVYEAPLGIPFEELLELAGGVRNGGKLKAVIPGGASAPILTAKEAEGLPMDFDGVAERGSMLGSAAVIVMDKTTDMVKAVTNISKFFAHESCGQCTPCREGVPWMYKILRRLAAGGGQPADIDVLLEIAAQNGNGLTLCVFADAAIAPVLSGISKFRAEFDAYARRSPESAAAPGEFEPRWWRASRSTAVTTRSAPRETSSRPSSRSGSPSRISAITRGSPSSDSAGSASWRSRGFRRSRRPARCRSGTEWR